MTISVGDVMTTDVVTAAPRDSFRSVVRLVEEHRVHALPVVSPERAVLGVVAESDLIVREVLVDGRVRFPLPRGDRIRLRASTAGELMTAPAVVIGPDRSLGRAVQLLRRRHIGRLPVVDEGRRLVGIVTRSDLLRVYLRSDEELHAAVVAAIGEAQEVAPGAIGATVEDGVVELRGEAQFLSEVMDVAARVRRVPGVVHLHVRATATYDDVHAAMVGP